MLRPSALPRRSRLQAPRSHEARNRREETALFSVRHQSAVRRWWIYSWVNPEALVRDPGRAMEAVAPSPCPRLEMSMVPPFALTNVDAIQNPRPEPGTVA